MKLKMVEIDGSILVKNGINIDDIVIKNIVETLKSTYNGIIDGCIVTFIDDSLEIWLNGENEEFLNLNIGQDIIDKFFQGIVKADYREKSDKQAITYCFSHFIGLLADRERFINENDGDFNNRDDSKDYYDSRNCKASIIELKQQLDRELKLEKYIILKLKYSVELSRVYDFIDADLDMLFSLVISSIKKIKNNTMELIVELEDCDYLNKISIKNNNSLKIGNIISEMQDEFYRRYEIKRWIKKWK